MEASFQPVDNAERPPIFVGVVVDDSSRADVLAPIIEGLGWAALRFDVLLPLDDLGDEISLVILSLSRIDEAALELVASVDLQSRANVLVISDDRNPQVIADTLRSGADDYLVSPFATAELVARMRSLVMRIWPTTDRRVGNGIAFDFEKRRISAGPYAVHFSPLEWDVLSVLLEHDGSPVSVEAIVSDPQLHRVQTSTIPTIVSRIRRKLEAGEFRAITVTTVQNRGYVAQFRRASDQLKAVKGTTNRFNGNGGSSAHPCRPNDQQSTINAG